MTRKKQRRKGYADIQWKGFISWSIKDKESVSAALHQGRRIGREGLQWMVLGPRHDPRHNNKVYSVL